MVAAHAAYFQPLGGHIVIIVLSNAAVLTKKKEWNFTFSCAYYDDHAHVLAVAPAKFSRRDTVDCSLPSEKYFESPYFKEFVPEFVILYRKDSTKFDPLKNAPPWLLPVTNNYKKFTENNGKIDGDLAICVKIIYGESNWLLLVQFFEYYRLQSMTVESVKIYLKELVAQARTAGAKLLPRRQ